MPYSEDVPAGKIGELHFCDRLAGLLCGGLAFTLCREGYGLLAWVLLILMAGGLFRRRGWLRAERGGVGKSFRGTGGSAELCAGLPLFLQPQHMGFQAPGQPVQCKRRRGTSPHRL